MRAVARARPGVGTNSAPSIWRNVMPLDDSNDLARGASEAPVFGWADADGTPLGASVSRARVERREPCPFTGRGKAGPPSARAAVGRRRLRGGRGSCYGLPCL